MYLIINTTQKESMVMIFQDENIIASFLWESSNNQSEELLVNIDKVIKKSNKSLKDLRGVVVITGPGSYTGIRVGVATANALAFSLNVNIFGIDMLEILSAYNFDINSKNNAIIVLIHAIYDKYYYAKYYQVGNIDIIRQKVGNEKIAKIMADNKAEYLVLSEQGNNLEVGSTIKLSNIKFQNFIAKYTFELFRKKTRAKYAQPYYLNQPNITMSK